MRSGSDSRAVLSRLLSPPSSLRGLESKLLGRDFRPCPQQLLVTGGETLTAALLTHLLHSTLPRLQIHTTCVGVSDEDLFERGHHLVAECGAIYNIDAHGVDLAMHLKAALEQYTSVRGFETIIDLTGFVGGRPDLRNLLVEAGLYVDWVSEKETGEGGMVGLRGEDGGIRLFGELIWSLPREVLEYGG